VKFFNISVVITKILSLILFEEDKTFSTSCLKYGHRIPVTMTQFLTEEKIYFLLLDILLVLLSGLSWVCYLEFAWEVSS